MSKMASQSRIRKQFGAILDQKAGELIRFQAVQGDGTGTVKVPGKTNYIYIRRLGRSRFEECLNVKLAPRNDLPIIVGYTAANPGTLEALEVDWIAITDPGDYVYVPHHHQAHELGNEHGGDDVVWVQKQQVLPMLCRPTDPASMFVIVLDDWYPWAAGWHYFAGATSADLSGYIPALFGEARFVLISIDGATNVLQYTSGSTFTIGLPLENIDVRVPAPPLGCVPVCAVYIAGTTTALSWENLYDVRLFNSPGAGSIAPNPDLWENVIVVAKSGGMWALIQDGLDAAVGGDTVLVMPGYYAEDLTEVTNNVTLLGLAAKHVTGPYGALISGDAAEVGPMLAWSGNGTICNMLFSQELTLAGGGYTVVLVTGEVNIVDCRVHISEGVTGRNVLSFSVGGVGDVIDISRCYAISPGASSPTAVSLNGGTVEITDCRFYGDVVCSASTQVGIQGSYIDGDLTGVAGSDLVITDSVVTGTIAGWDSVTYHGLSTFPLGTAHQLVKVNAGATNPVWASFDWDEIGAAVAADMVHDHGSDTEGGLLPATSVEVEEVGAATYDDIQDWLNTTQSAGRLSGGAVTAHAYPITGVTVGGAGAGEFKVDGDHTAAFTAGVILTVSGSTNNDGDYTVSAGGATFAGGVTTIPVDEAVAAVADGNIAAGTVDVALGTGLIKVADAHLAATRFFDWAATTVPLIPTNNASNWIYADYNAGAPIVGITDDRSIITRNDIFTIDRLWRIDSELHIIGKGMNAYNLGMRTHRNLVKVFHFQRGDGLMLTESGLRKVDVTAGNMYRGLNEIPTSHIDTDDGDSFTTLYRDGGGGWTWVTGQTAIDNVNYDDGTGVLEPIVNNQYGVYWVYFDYDSHLYIQYGQDSYRLGEAEVAHPPTTAPFLSSFSMLIAKIVVKEGGAENFYSVEYPWDTVFVGAPIAVHNNLGGLQGGTVDEYYHLTAAEHGAVIGGSGVANRIAYWSGANTLTSDAGLTYSAATDSLTIAGHMAVGATSVVTVTAVISVHEAPTPVAGDFFGIDLGIDFSPGANFGTNVYGLRSGTTLQTAHSRTDGVLFGLFGQARIGVGIDARDVKITGGQFATFVQDAGVGGGVGAAEATGLTVWTPFVNAGSCASGYGIRIRQGTIGAGLMTTLYGLYIDALTVGGTTYAIYSLGGDSYHAGDFTFGGNLLMADDKFIGITGDIRIEFDQTDGDIMLHLGDAAGVDKVQVLDSGSNVVAYTDSDGNADFEGHVAVGNNATVQALRVIYAGEQATSPTLNKVGLQATLDFAPTGNFSSSMFGCVSTVQVTTAHARTAGGIYGIWGWVSVADGVAASNLYLYGLLYYVDVEDATATSAEGIRISTPYVDTGLCGVGRGITISKGPLGAVAAGNRVTTLTGLYLTNMEDAKAGTSYAIYSAGGNSYHAGKVSIGGTVAPLAQLHVDQNSPTATIPVLYLDQADVSEPFTNYVGTSAASAANSLSSWTTGNAVQGHIQIDVNGVKRWLRFYDDPTS